MTDGPALYVDGLSVRFGSLRAIDNLSLLVNRGEIRAIIGPNGAGKTTLLDIVTGKTRPDTGTVLLDGGLDLLAMSEPQIALAGVGRKFQKPSVFEALSVRDNLRLALRAPGRSIFAEMGHRLGAAEEARAEAMLERIGMAGMGARRAGVLSHGEKQWLEIGMLLLQEPRVLLLDEPVAGMSDSETDRTAELVLSLRAPDRAIVVIEHDMSFVERIADVVTVLHEGRTLVEGSMARVQADARVRDVYLGR
ncbi:urea ABC transporter ATP-binding protein UrtD [Azospirillum sp. RWY-5-1]|uniref:Urea ABC transporter ATP-binding protein UrtD n=1 Tax=Azospirillum oleiclasticum TaxID=2735135 RepID=A0ABX2TFV7_9PROT|nr:urea ABC transporter ATP-binding protein UrtD [Azospirillum oleiclasticum]NYZ14428.1 urea ABC transporter ATP-binding protein UrtD [Azospirillum oleiclasticum]NYZ23220.1 urea ABC transporter ATP-binding protein UrtD [Azospirillum oleiclasticum]